MAFEQVVDLSPDNVIALGGFNKKTRKDNPTSAEGYYLGSRRIADNKKNDGIGYIHVLKTPRGDLGVWGKTDLDRKLLGTTPGVMVRITFDRMVPTPKGEMYKFKVEVDKDNVIEVANLVQGSSDAGAQDTGYDDSNVSEGTDGYQENDDSDDDASQAAALAAAERQAKVQALLRNKGKNAKN